MNRKILTKELEDKSRDDIIDDLYHSYKKNLKLEKEKEKLERELKKYKNAHTPSSKNRLSRPKPKGIPVGRKKGKKSGHKGKTRSKDIVTNVEEVTSDVDPNLEGKTLRKTGYVEQIVITDFRIEKIVTQYNCYEYKDLKNGEIITAKHPNMPKRGIFGKNVLAFASYLRFHCRVPFDKIASCYTKAFDISMTSPTAMDICNRVAEKVTPEFEILKKDIKREKIINADETSARQNGLPGWLWGFFSLNIALLLFNKKRGGDIIEKTLGKYFNGIIGCDGWSTYEVFSKKTGILLQRCWAHALREVKDLCIDLKKPNKNLEQCYIWLCDIFEKIKEARRYECKELREQFYVELVDELNSWIQVYKGYKKLKKTVKKIENGKEFWFTCVLYLDVEPTNNRAERGIRPWVILEKIIGTLRSKQGMKTTETMLSLFSTWDLRKLNSYAELRSLL